MLKLIHWLQTQHPYKNYAWNKGYFLRQWIPVDIDGVDRRNQPRGFGLKGR